MSHHIKAHITALQKNNVATLVRENIDKLEASYVMFDAQDHEVIVRDGSKADLEFRTGPPGACMPTGTHTVDEVLYRTYMVSPEILGK